MSTDRLFDAKRGGELSPVRFERCDDRFTCAGDEHLERLWTGGRWVEGPVYVPASKCLLFNDIPNDRTLRWDEGSGCVTTFEQPCGYRNGQTMDRAGRIIACEQGGRRVVRTEHDGRRTTIASQIGGRRLNSPNDVVGHSDGSIWFTDPPYGITSDYEGVRAETELDGCHVYRVDPATGACQQITTDLTRPNGLAFSTDERILYVADTANGLLSSFTIDPSGVGPGEVFATVEFGKVDGIRVDADDNVWVAAGAALHCFHPDGALLGRLHLPETCSNLTFGGPKGNRLFICATSSLYSLMLNINGARPAQPPARGDTFDRMLGEAAGAAGGDDIWVGFVGYCDPDMVASVQLYEGRALDLLDAHGASARFRGVRAHGEPATLPVELQVLHFPSRSAYTAFMVSPERLALRAEFGHPFTTTVTVELDVRLPNRNRT